MDSRRVRWVGALSGLAAGLGMGVSHGLLLRVQDVADMGLDLSTALLVSMVVYVPIAVLGFAPVGAWLAGRRPLGRPAAAVLRSAVGMGGYVGLLLGSVVGLAVSVPSPAAILTVGINAWISGPVGGLVGGLAFLALRRRLLGAVTLTHDASAGAAQPLRARQILGLSVALCVLALLAVFGLWLLVVWALSSMVIL